MSNPSTICVDASIIVKLILKPDDAVLRQLWDWWIAQGYRLMAPTLLYYEVANGLYQQEAREVLSSEFVRDALDFVINLPVELVGDTALHQHAHALAREYKLPNMYIAHYLALAERLDCEFWTTDKELFDRVKGRGVKRARLVKNKPPQAKNQ